MRPSTLVRHAVRGAAAMALAAAGLVPVGMNVAVADGCPHAEVIFARGTGEPPGPGQAGQSFYDALVARGGEDTVDLYSVDYPASMDFPTASRGIVDARNRVEDMAARCPDTKLVLGGYSQGAAVIGYLTADHIPPGVDLPPDITGPMPAAIADQVAAVVLFGEPSSGFLQMISAPPIIIGPLYRPKTINLCADGDFVCGDGSSGAAHESYPFNGLTDRAADFAAARI